jgi:UDP-2,3-diacylglucosamine pyrophosphatase LpxH
MTYDEMIRLYAKYKTFDTCATVLKVNRKSFSKYWYAKGLPNPRLIPKMDYSSELEKYKIAVCGDLHLGSNQQQPTAFLNFIDQVSREEIKTLIILGDLVEGLMKRDGSVHNRFLHSIDDIYEYTQNIFNKFVDNFDRILIIEGNHDATLNGRCDGFDLCHHMAMDYKNIEYESGPNNMILPVIIDGGARAILYHGSGNCSKNLTMRTRNKTIDFMNMFNQFDILLAAHCHRSSFDIWLHKYGVSVGCFQSTTHYLAMKGMAPQIQGTVLSYNIGDDGKVKNMIPIPYNYDDKIIMDDF